MIAAFHLDNWLFILLIAVAMLFRWLASVASKASKSSDERDEGSTSTPPTAGPAGSASPAGTVPGVPVESDEERIRKFLEALGQPPGSSPPPPVAHRTDIPPRPVAPILPPAEMRPFSLPERRLTPEERRKRGVILHTAPAASATVFKVHEITTPSEPAPPIKSPAEAYAIRTEPKTEPARSETSIALLLRSPSGLRNAIILREVFGPPRSLQPLELV